MAGHNLSRFRNIGQPTPHPLLAKTFFITSEEEQVVRYPLSGKDGTRDVFQENCRNSLRGMESTHSSPHLSYLTPQLCCPPSANDHSPGRILPPAAEYLVESHSWPWPSDRRSSPVEAS